MPIDIRIPIQTRIIPPTVYITEHIFIVNTLKSCREQFFVLSHCKKPAKEKTIEQKQS